MFIQNVLKKTYYIVHKNNIWTVEKNQFNQANNEVTIPLIRAMIVDPR